MKKLTSFVAAAIVASSFSFSAQASTLIADNFTRITPAENLVAPFTANAGITTVGSYTGFVEILVSGNGFSNGSRPNDAFYHTPEGTSLANNFYHLGIGTPSLPWSPTGLNTPNRGIENYMSFINGVGSAGPGSIPAFNSNGVYNFVVNLSSPSSPLTFGVLDGVYADNGGQYNLSVWQLSAGVAAVPEPATWLMMLIGFGAIGAITRRKQHGFQVARLT